MRRAIAVLVLLAMPLSVASGESAITRRDGFLTIWQSLRRPVQPTRDQAFVDVPEESKGFAEITYAKVRGILDDEERFLPDDPLTPHEALVWLLRTRNVDEPDAIEPSTLSGYLLRYALTDLPMASMTEDDLLSVMRKLDTVLSEEEHEVSLYAEEFHGLRTAFGETFDMHALTAAHRTYPHNTVVRVTNVANGKSVVVRINDRGPFVPGRDMDLSLAAFTSIADRSLGVIRARLERLGDATLFDPCAGRLAGRSLGEGRYQERLTRGVRLRRGIPHVFKLGDTLTVGANRPFVVRSIRYPDTVLNAVQDWILPSEQFTFKPSLPGDYLFRLGTLHGRHRILTMRVVEC